MLVDDDPTVARFVIRLMATKGIAVEHVGTRAEIDRLIHQRVGTEAIDVILLDVDLADMSGLDVLAALRAQGAPTAIVMLTGDDSAGTATAALRGGAFHYVVKSQTETLDEVIGAAARHAAFIRQAQAGSDEDSTSRDVLVGASPPIARLRKMVTQIARSTASVLITGESGTGKELVAHTLHALSPRRDKAFVALNCGGIPEGLIDSELFGHVRGAFTGAVAARPGVFVQAHGGTLFLDEIGDMPLAVQVRLLRALQEGEVRAVGDDKVRAVDVRVVAATNVDLARAVQDGRFRADLYFRLNVVSLAVPPLRERKEDLPKLIAALLRRHDAGKMTLHADTLEVLGGYGWPGNVRELENALLHALAMTSGDVIEPSALPPTLLAATAFDADRFANGSGLVTRLDPEPGDDSVPLTEAKKRAALDFERSYLLKILEQAKGSISAAARLAGIDRTNFRRLLQRHHIDSARFR